MNGTRGNKIQNLDNKQDLNTETAQEKWVRKQWYRHVLYTDNNRIGFRDQK